MDHICRHRDGRNIGWWQLVCALHEVYNLSYFFAMFLAAAGVIFCGHWHRLPWSLDLHQLAEHNRIEHDCSLAHDDAAPGAKFAPHHTDHTLLCRLLDTSRKALPLGLGDFVAARIQRAEEVRRDIGRLHREIAHGETALVMLTMGRPPQGVETCQDSSLVVPKDFIQVWFGRDQLPDSWEKPKEEVGLFRTASLSRAIGQELFRKDYIAQCA